ncbi:hypothetical protein [Nonomuraea turcica]|uniref:hypothetical protein n=1 Tax=Nonomuraea sp. G32 TaxID=3067274 RepID=UPI00273C8BE5|nr:hypothetical protein [Nonomuraea sp. G32]MDP4512055.1 hypothetical protein [Nonomuraea sp. G32]
MMARAAKDDAESERNRARLYAPPQALAIGRGRRRSATPAASAAPAAPGRRAGAAMTRSQALAMMAEINVEDARLSPRGRNG